LKKQETKTIFISLEIHLQPNNFVLQDPNLPADQYLHTEQAACRRVPP
jgi:hypothetical protein